jgi:hypothetical protein
MTPEEEVPPDARYGVVSSRGVADERMWAPVKVLPWTYPFTCKDLYYKLKI